MRLSDIILPKIEDEIVKANLFKATAVPSQRIFFNIDQVFDGIGGDHSAPILEGFVKVLNELHGYYGKQVYIAKFKYGLGIRGELKPFKETYLKLNGATWEKGREAIATARKAALTKAYAAHFGVAEANNGPEIAVLDAARLYRETPLARLMTLTLRKVQFNIPNVDVVSLSPVTSSLLNWILAFEGESLGNLIT